MKQTTFWRCFLTEDRLFNGLKRSTEKVTAVASLTRVQVVVDHTMSTPLQRSTKLNISHWYFDQCVYQSRFHLLSKKSWASVFLRNFFHSHPFDEMFIVNAKFHCCIDTYQHPVYIAASKEYLRRIQIILCWENLHFISYFVWNFHLNWLIFLRVTQQNKVDVFFWTQCMMKHWSASKPGACGTWTVCHLNGDILDHYQEI